MKVGSRWLLLALVNLLWMLGLVAGGELFLRVRHSPRYAPRPPFDMLHPTQIFANRPGLHHTYYGADFHLHITTDDWGNRLDTLGAPAPEHGLVLLVGDSYTFGWGVSDDDTLAAALNQQLRPQGLAVVNLGVPGFSTLAMAQRLREYLATIDPRRVRAIAVFHSDNDAVDNVLYLLYQNRFQEPFCRPWSAHTPSHLLNWALSKIYRPPGAGWQLGRSGALQYRGRNYGQFEKLDLKSETDVLAGREKSSYTALQKELLRQGLLELNQLCPAGALIHHFVLYLGPHSGATEKAFAECYPPPSPGVVVHGLIPLHGWPAEQPVHNAHRGGHYTPEFNRFLASYLEGKLSHRPLAP